MSAVIMVLWLMIQRAYVLHDQVTGSMILHEAVELSVQEKIRNCPGLPDWAWRHWTGFLPFQEAECSCRGMGMP